MKNKFYIMTALVISLTGCSNIEDGTQPTGNFPEDHIIRIVTEVNAPVSRAGYDASNLESFGLIIHNSENIAYDYNSQMVTSNNDWNTADGQQMLWDNARTPVTVVAYAPYISEASLDTPLAINIQSNQTTEENVIASDFLLTKSMVDPKQDLTADGRLKVTLDHAMSKLIIKVTVNNGMEDAAISKLGDMAVNGTIVGGICDLSVPEPVFIPREDAVATTIAPYKGTDGYECILLPQTIIEGFSVNFSYDGKLYIWTAEEPIELQKGVEHTLTLNVNETARLATMQMKYRATGQIIDQK